MLIVEMLRAEVTRFPKRKDEVSLLGSTFICIRPRARHKELFWDIVYIDQRPIIGEYVESFKKRLGF